LGEKKGGDPSRDLSGRGGTLGYRRVNHLREERCLLYTSLGSWGEEGGQKEESCFGIVGFPQKEEGPSRSGGNSVYASASFMRGGRKTVWGVKEKDA